MVALPITNDQPGVAARIAYTRTGEMISIRKLKTEKLRHAIKRVMTDPSYRENARKIQTNIRQHRGAQEAADLIIAVLTPAQT